MSFVLATDAPPPVEPVWAATGIATAVALAIGVVVFMLVRSARAGIRTTDDFVVGQRAGVKTNALAMVGGCVMYSTVIIMIGHIALTGFDAIVLLTSFTLAPVVALLVYAGPARNVGGNTLGDLFALRAQERPARIASAVLTLLVYAMFTVIAVGSMALVTHRLFSNSTDINVPFVGGIVALVGLLAIAAVWAGGMTAVTRVLVLKVVLMIVVVAVLTVLIMVKYKMNLIDIFNDAENKANPDKRGYDLLDTGRLFDKGSTANSGQDPWVHMSKTVSIALGAMGLPFLFIRNYVARSGREARRSAGLATIITVLLWQAIIIIGLAAIAILGREKIGILALHRDITLPKLADDLGGGWLVGLLAGVALLAVGALFATLLISAVSAIVNDVNAVRGRTTEVKDIRRTVLVLGIVSLVFGLGMSTQFTHIFIPTSIDIGATCVLPAVVLSLFWRRFNTRGLQWVVYGGIALTVLMVVFSNGISGDPRAFLPDADFKILDIEPGVIGAPLGFLLGYFGSITSPERNDAAFAETQVRALTGAVLSTRKHQPAQSSDTPNAETLQADSRAPSEAH